MSDHLIAEANRHAKALTDERNNLVVELNLLREWQRETIQNERAHHAERKDAIARAERAEAEIKDRAAMMRDVMRERDAAEISLTAERAIVSRIWVQLGSPTYAQLKGRSIYDLIDEIKTELATERARLDHVFTNEWLVATATRLTMKEASK
jgi:hypothetical protein